MSSDVEHVEDDSQLETSALELVPQVVLEPWSNNRTRLWKKYPQDVTVATVIREIDVEGGEIRYEARFQNGSKYIISFQDLLGFQNGHEALAAFQERSGDEVDEVTDEEIQDDISDHEDQIVLPQRTRRAPYSVTLLSDEDSEDELVHAPAASSKGRHKRQARLRSTRLSQRQPFRRSGSSLSSDSESEPRLRRQSARIVENKDGLRRSRRNASDADLVFLVDEDEDEDDNSSDANSDLLESDVLKTRKRRKRSRFLQSNAAQRNSLKYLKMNNGTRQSSRTTRHQKHMGEIEVTEIYRSDSDTPRPKPKPVGAREVFQPLPSTNKFHLRHCQQCETCGKWGGGPYGQLIHCQGCSLSYHKHCLGTRSVREHLVTKVGEANFVLQCRRCIRFARTKDKNAPDQGICQHCRERGPACKPFRKPKTPAQEEKEREDNGGEDPIVVVAPELINNVANVLFRCLTCWRAFHFHHLRSRSDIVVEDTDEDRIAEARFKEHALDWQCSDCIEMPAKVSGLVAWRPVDSELYLPDASVQDLDEDLKEYLIKWEAKSYFQCRWMPGAWTWGITAPAMRKAFAKREKGPVMNTEDAIPEDYLRIDIVLDVRFTSYVDTRAEEVDKARIREVDKALIKYKGLGYEDAVWEGVPTPDDGERWSDFVKAYDDWVMGRYIKTPKLANLKVRLEKTFATDFATLEKKKQPDKLTGGELMKYQLDGLNWLYYRWWSRKNAILADEMGLGKTIQIVAFLTTLIQDHHCFPFLVVVPNGTVANWRREIKQWAPSLRVVTYFGSSQSRSMAYQYELFPKGAKELRCHIVVTSYEAAADESSRRFFRIPTWQGLIVDEGQRLKSDRTILHEALTALKIPFKVLLTGTPLQNNARELFNLLQFLDDTFDAEAFELEYAELTKENVPKLHELIRPFFLRRTKAQVLTFLPPMAQIVLPVSMSSVQAKLYKSILSKNPELIRALYDPTRPIKAGERSMLNNILMQLRKCLCHPFVFSDDIEERTLEASVSHRNLVEASSKLQLLEALLPKLKERGHRVLIFSQFLHMLDIIEDFLDGLSLPYKRLDGTIQSMEKQKRIDAFNAPNSPLFAFLLSTRAGGVGINLATADTVIILDPDFNPHQDIQALSRAHRIGQKNKVLCFQFMTRATVEEKIMQVGRKKMALDHLLIDQMDKDEEETVDVESILRFGAADILEGKTQDIKYDDTSVDKLLDRSAIESTKAGEDNSAESQFSFARVWANDTETLTENLDTEGEKAPDQSVWDRILKEREQQAAEEAAARQQLLGRGRRTRQIVDYTGSDKDNFVSPHKKADDDKDKTDSDTDFQADGKKSDDEISDEGANNVTIDPVEVAEVQYDPWQPGQSSQPYNYGGLASQFTTTIHPSISSQPRPRTQPVVTKQVRYEIQHSIPMPQTQPGLMPQNQPTKPMSQFQPISQPIPVSIPQHIAASQPVPTYRSTPSLKSTPVTYSAPLFQRANIRWPDPAELDGPTADGDSDSDAFQHPVVLCPVCRTRHRRGFCPLKIAGPEYCNLCGLAHYGQGRSCPHIRSETQVRDMLVALKQSPESKELIDYARKYLSGVKGTLVQEKKKKAERVANRLSNGIAQLYQGQTHPNATNGRPDASDQYTTQIHQYTNSARPPDVAARSQYPQQHPQQQQYALSQQQYPDPYPHHHVPRSASEVYPQSYLQANPHLRDTPPHWQPQIQQPQMQSSQRMAPATRELAVPQYRPYASQAAPNAGANVPDKTASTPKAAASSSSSSTSANGKNGSRLGSLPQVRSMPGGAQYMNFR